eukprot:1159541-Pelagomonas_calceolata.AAC.3
MPQHSINCVYATIATTTNYGDLKTSETLELRRKLRSVWAQTQHPSPDLSDRLLPMLCSLIIFQMGILASSTKLFCQTCALIPWTRAAVITQQFQPFSSFLLYLTILPVKSTHYFFFCCCVLMSCLELLELLKLQTRNEHAAVRAGYCLLHPLCSVAAE